MITILFDADDTLFDTVTALTNELKQTYNQAYPANPFAEGYKVTPELDAIVSTCQNMLVSELFEPLKNITEWMREMRTKYDVKFGLCTHRGGYEKGKEYTQQRCNELGIVWDIEIYLDSKVHPDKIKYLNETLGEFNWILVDDRPRREKHKFLPRNVVLVQKIWNNDMFVTDPEQRVTHAGIYARVESLLQLIKRYPRK